MGSKSLNMNKLNETLKAEAIAIGLCQQWQNDWVTNKSSVDLIEMYKRGIDFCIDHEWPSCDWIISHFDKAELRDRNIFVGESGGEIVLSNGVAVVRDCREVSISIPRNSVVTLHCQRNGHISVTLHKGARAFIHLHDTPAAVEAIETMATAKIYQYGPESEVETNGNVVVKSAMK